MKILPCLIQVHLGEGARSSSSRDDAVDDSNKFPSAPGTPDCNNSVSNDNHWLIGQKRGCIIYQANQGYCKNNEMLEK